MALDPPVSIDADNGPPLAEQLRQLLDDAVRESATDIHIDPDATGAMVRFRVGGVVHTKQQLREQEAERLINQIKIAAQCSIEATLQPEDGQFRYRGRELRDVRTTITPTHDRRYAAHLRLLQSPNELLDIRNLGLSEPQIEHITRAVQGPAGLVLVAGVTGTGKTTTLYSLAMMQDLTRQIAAAIEDPVEFDIPLVRQLEVNRHNRMTMNDGLRTLLRMDPDILLIGEIRDRESATTAAHAALSGRMVMTTIHARDAAAAIDSFHYLSVPYYVIGATLRLVIGQDLVRRVCSHCAHHRPLHDAERRLYQTHELDAPDQVAEAVGCERCHGYGYNGRIGVFSVALIDADTGTWLAEGRRQGEIRQRLRGAGSRGLLYDALAKAATGVTTLQEAMRFLSPSPAP